MNGVHCGHVSRTEIAEVAPIAVNSVREFLDRDNHRIDEVILVAYNDEHPRPAHALQGDEQVDEAWRTYVAPRESQR